MTAAPLTRTIQPLAHPPAAVISVPGSKSITNRALMLAALSSRERPIELSGTLRAEDTEVMVDCLNVLGFRIRPDWDKATIHVDPVSRDQVIPAARADLYVANSGTTMRFLTALVSLGHGTYRLHGTPRMHERPIADLLDALDQLGVRTSCENSGCPPVRIGAAGWQRGKAHVRGAVSSQFLSGLMLAAPFAAHDTRLTFDDTVSRPYVDMTAAMLRQWSLELHEEAGLHGYRIPAPQRSPLSIYPVEPDASAASYFFAAAAITAGRVAVPRLSPQSLQGDVQFVDLLQRMGCTVIRARDFIEVQGGELRGIDTDMNAISDTVMTLAVVACFADGPTLIRNVAHIRHKETDRLFALATELRRLGAGVEEFADGLRINPAPLRGATVLTYNDHRMAMSLALLGLRIPGVVVSDPDCVAKTYPGFFADLENLR